MDLDLFSGSSGSNQVTGKVRLPRAQVHNAKDARGVGGGLFIPDQDNAPADLEINNDVFKSVTLVFDDSTSPGSEVKAPGWISDNYKVCILAYPKNDKGYPSAYKTNYQGKEKWVFPVVLAFKDAFSPSTPFKVTFSGTQAFRMMNIVSGFGNFAVATVSRLLQEKGRGPAGFTQFWLPIKHSREQLGKGDKVSWGCPVQDYQEGSIKITSVKRPTGIKEVRQGVSIYKPYSDEKNKDKLFDLAIAKSPDGKELVELFAKWSIEFADLVKPIELSSGTSKIKDDFASSPETEATDSQRSFLFKMAKDSNTDVDLLIERMIKNGSLTVGPGISDKSFMGLSKSGASKVIDELKLIGKEGKSISDTIPSNVVENLPF